MKKFLLPIVIAMLTGCTDVHSVSRNLSSDADDFKVNRRTVFYNGVTSEYILTIEGKCSIAKDKEDNQLEVVCKTGESSYKKHILGISDNVTYFSEQIEGASVSAYHYRVVFKPLSIIPDVEVR